MPCTMQVTPAKRKQRRKSKRAKAHSLSRSLCPIANVLEVVGDKWSLLIVRDLFRGKSTYGELLNSFEKIPTNILAERLKRLEAAGIITSSPYQERPVRNAYTLTKKGSELADILQALVKWGKRHIPGTKIYANQRRVLRKL
ncbi:MAG TPA: helix-turn-helix domain-containing protein [Blastocatellia bacterium]|nr:helix-turn-helix domain-containing protein [Blastocatellia bacterium]